MREAASLDPLMRAVAVAVGVARRGRGRALPQLLPAFARLSEHGLCGGGCVGLLRDDIDHLLRREDFPHAAARQHQAAVGRAESDLLDGWSRDDAALLGQGVPQAS